MREFHWALPVAAAMILSACGSGPEAGGDTASGSGEQSAAEVADAISGIQLKPGTWDVRMDIDDVEFTGMAAGPQTEQVAAAMKQAMGGRVVQSCITPEQAANPQADFLSAQKEANCAYSDFNMSGGTIKGTMSCKGDGPNSGGGTMTMTMAGTYTPDSYSIKMTMQGNGMGGGGDGPSGMTIKARTSGSWKDSTCQSEAG